METTKKRKKYVWWTDTEWNEVKELWSDWTSDNNPSTPKFRECLLSSFGDKYDDAGCPSERAMRRKLMGDFTGENVVNNKKNLRLQSKYPPSTTRPLSKFHCPNSLRSYGRLVDTRPMLDYMNFALSFIMAIKKLICVSRATPPN